MGERDAPSFGGDNNVAGDQTFGDVDKSQHSTTTIEGNVEGDVMSGINNNVSASWDEIARMLNDDDDEGHSFLLNMEEVATQVGEYTDEDMDAWRRGCAWMAAQVPTAMPMVKQLVADKPELLALLA